MSHSYNTLSRSDREHLYNHVTLDLKEIHQLAEEKDIRRMVYKHLSGQNHLTPVVQGFFYKAGTYDAVYPEVFPSWYSRNALDPSLHEEMNEILKKAEEVRITTKHVEYYLRKVFIKASSFKDIETLTPASFQPILEKSSGYHYVKNTALSFTQDEVDTFLEDNESGMNYFKKHLMRKLLTGGL